MLICRCVYPCVCACVCVHCPACTGDFRIPLSSVRVVAGSATPIPCNDPVWYQLALKSRAVKVGAVVSANNPEVLMDVQVPCVCVHVLSFRVIGVRL